MKIGYVQFKPVFGQNAKNIERILGYLTHGARNGTDLLVFPELCISGYVFKTKREVEKLSEEIPEGITSQILSDFAEENGINIVIGLAEKERKAFYNSAAIFGPKGYLGKYRKAHLFYEEKLWFRKGNTPFPVYDIGRAKIGVMICFDWFFPEVMRIITLRGADIICHPANLVLPYSQTAMLGAAVQNKVFVVTSNRVGSERGLRFTGRSQIVDPKMRILAKSAESSEDMKLVKIDPRLARNKTVTRYNDLVQDRRRELYLPLVSR